MITNHHYLTLDDAVFKSADTDMQPIFRRLIMTASNVEMRQDMNVEDEYSTPSKMDSQN